MMSQIPPPQVLIFSSGATQSKKLENRLLPQFKGEKYLAR